LLVLIILYTLYLKNSCSILLYKTFFSKFTIPMKVP